MDNNETLENENETSFTTEIAKTFALSLAATAGVWGGIIAVGSGVVAVQKFRENRKSKKLHLVEETN